MSELPLPSAEFTGKASRINELRERLRRIERGRAAERPAVPLGLPELDRALGGGLPAAALHELLGHPQEGAMTGFALALLARLLGDPVNEGRPALWCGRRLDLYGPGLAAFLDPRRLILVEVAKPADLLWAMEEGLRCPGLAAVVGELDRLDLTAGRRLQLAAEAGGVTGLVLRGRSGMAAAEIGASAATTRWRIAAAPAPELRGFAGPVPRSLASAWGGSACWRVELLRCRGGRPQDWMVEWHDATGDLALAAALRDRPAEAQAAG